MAEEKLFDFKEVMTIAKQYINPTYIPDAKQFEHVLDYVRSDYDYIFEVLEHEILEGDFKAPKLPTSFDLILRYDNYLVALTHNNDGWPRLMVVKVLTIAGM